MTGYFNNPILPGFHPDPSICRVGEDYYMATSSFAYFPGIPLFHSRDLVHWEQIGHVIHRREQLDFDNCQMALGLWAPTLRFHQGRFYLINTFVSEGLHEKRMNYIVTAENPAGPWSDPVVVEGADGIDPSLYFGEDGKMWYIGNFICQPEQYDGHHGIYLQQIDPETFQFCSERYVLWDGIQTQGKWLEAPHIYHHGNWYYLMVAEGGTFTNHCVMMARSREITGPYEICQRNPIVTHRHMPLMSEISVVGHADLVETTRGEWWMVLLGVRPYEGFHYNLGRETFLVPVTWDTEDEWLKIDNANGQVNSRERKPELEETVYPVRESFTGFEGGRLGLQWNSVHPLPEGAYSLTRRSSFLSLRLRSERLETVSTPSFIGRRQEHKEFQVQTAMEFEPQSEDQEAGLALLQDEGYNYQFLIGSENGAKCLRLYQVEQGEKMLLKSCVLPEQGRWYMTIRGQAEYYNFYISSEEGSQELFYEKAPAAVLSTRYRDGFTGVYIGMYAVAATDSDNYAEYDWFQYTPA